MLALRSGEIDAITGAARLSADAYTELSADSSFGTAINDEPTLTNYIGFNMAKSHLMIKMCVLPLNMQLTGIPYQTMFSREQ